LDLLLNVVSVLARQVHPPLTSSFLPELSQFRYRTLVPGLPDRGETRANIAIARSSAARFVGATWSYIIYDGWLGCGTTAEMLPASAAANPTR